jgi:2-oxoglutarate ferredoxin oxidoreductase subunit gamma
MRGGTANVTVIIGDKEIGSPIVREPQIAIVLNNPSMEKYEPLVYRGGMLIYNSSLISTAPQRTDITYIPVPANEIAQELGNVKVANIVALGVMVAATQLLPLEAVHQALNDHLPAAKQSLLAINQAALQRGAALVESLETVH